MKFSNPIDVDFRLFFLTGKFDCIKPGQTKEWISCNFPDPDDLGLNDGIWRYGWLEFHFFDEKLITIWCDYLDELESDEQLTYAKWILDKPSMLSLPHVLNILTTESVNYKVRHNKEYKVVAVKIAESNVVLHFELPSVAESAKRSKDMIQDPHEYRMYGFGLTHPDFESRWSF